MVEQDYVDFYNLAFGLAEQGKRHVERLSDEDLKNLQAIIRTEIEDPANPAPSLSLMQALVSDELQYRASPKPARAQPNNVVPFDRVPF